MPYFIQENRLANVEADTEIKSFQFVEDFIDKIVSNFTDVEQNEVIAIILDKIKTNRRQRIEEHAIAVTYLQKEYNNLIDILLKYSDESKPQMKRSV